MSTLRARKRVNAPDSINETKANGLRASVSAYRCKDFGGSDVLAPDMRKEAEAGYQKESWKSDAIERS